MGKVFMTSQINESPTITEKAGIAVADVRGLCLKYRDDGKVIPATTAGERVVGAAIITNSENVEMGDDIDIQVKEMGLLKAGGEIKKGAEVMAGSNGKAMTATIGKFVIGTALESATEDQLIYIQFSKYYKTV